MHRLGLTDAQKTQAKAIFKADREAVKPQFEKLRAEKKNLISLIHADAIDEAAVRAETAKIAGIRADIIIARSKAFAKFRAILTPEQLEILKNHLHQHRR